jgi:putative transposase
MDQKLPHIWITSLTDPEQARLSASGLLPRNEGRATPRALVRLASHRGAPARIFVDNGSEFSGQLLDLWAYHHHVQIDFSRPGKPTDNCFIETFNESLRDECLNVHWFESLEEASAKIEAWRVDYNESRPHQALNELTPSEYALKHRQQTTALRVENVGN